MADKTKTVNSYSDLYDATVKMEYELERLLNEGFSEGLKGEVLMINGRWRVSIVTGSNQLELDV